MAIVTKKNINEIQIKRFSQMLLPSNTDKIENNK